MEIRAGAGGDEAAIFAGELGRMYFRFVEECGFKVELIDKSEGAPGCVKEMIFAVRGNGAYGRLKYEIIVRHRPQSPHRRSSRCRACSKNRDTPRLFHVGETPASL